MLYDKVKIFSLNTNLHGYRFMFLPKRILCERVFWLVFVILSLITSLTLLSIVWVQYENSSTITLTDSTHHPIWYYDFPAVTICNYNKISKRKAYKFAAKYIKKNSDDYTLNELASDLKILLQLLDRSVNISLPRSNLRKLQQFFNKNNLEAYKVFENLSPSCDDMLKICKWKGNSRNCDNLFEQISTSDGFCCSFNYHALKNHTFLGHFRHRVPKQPRRVSACGYSSGLEVLVDACANDYFVSQSLSIGTGVFIHNPIQYPERVSQIILVEPKVNIFIGVDPTLTYSTKEFRKVPLNQRQCYLNNEKETKNFASYDYKNCMIECRMNITKKKCGCIQFQHYNPSGSYPKTRICNLNDLICLNFYKDLIMTSIPGLEASYDKWEPPKSECNCLPSCNSNEYVAETSLGPLTRTFLKNQEIFGQVEIKNESLIRVYFMDLVGTKNRNDVTFNWNTLLAYFGGLLGLFTGFSFISGVEIIYFFTIRFIYDTIKIKRKPKILNQRLYVKSKNSEITKKRLSHKTYFGGYID